MESNELQQQLFKHLKETIPAHVSLVDELCELLELSPDSVYRRLRGEKPVSFTELQKICLHYHLSLDHILHLSNESVLFDAPGMNNESSDFLDYLKAMLGQMKYFNTFKST